MKIFLENLYHSDCYFLPIRDNQQVLVGVELITHFSSEDGTVRIPTSRVIAQLTEEQHWQLFSEQLEGNDSNLLIVFYVQIMPDDFVMQLHRF